MPGPIPRSQPAVRAAATSAATPYAPPPELRRTTGQIRDDGAGGSVTSAAAGPHWMSVAPEERDSRSAARPAEDADEAGDDLWPELPEWVRPSCQHDLMTLLLKGDRLRRLVAEQTASLWSAPPF